ncbi:hypothetical protein [Massilia sp. S19_KUP03_FR1]|uniref:hypothetical protein n=1 Tax=Massilia sp. S19_KUP03_FR1 TaxID=3025503 RepID=UPI002FCDA4D4
MGVESQVKQLGVSTPPYLARPALIQRIERAHRHRPFRPAMHWAPSIAYSKALAYKQYERWTSQKLCHENIVVNAWVFVERNRRRRGLEKPAEKN